MKVIEIRKDNIIYQRDDGTINVEPNTPYFRIKILEFGGDRIKHDIPIEGIEIMETFDDMIFNVTINGLTITTRPNMADSIVESFNNTDKLLKIFERYNNQKYNIKLLEGFLKEHGDRIKTVPEGFVVDDMFLVDRIGNAWFWKNGAKDQSHRTNISTGAICIVVKRSRNHKVVDPTHGGSVEIDELGFIILSKINFLLEPNLDDEVFVNQMPRGIVEKLKRNRESINKSFI